MPESRRLDLEPAVKVILSTFAVFVGFTLTETVKSLSTQSLVDWNWQSVASLFEDPHWWLLVALVALLLRFIVGSSVHLNHTYVKSLKENAPANEKSSSVAMLFKDLAFLIIFGILAVFISRALTDPKALGQLTESNLQSLLSTFEFRCAVFLSVGLVWSAIDIVCRLIWGAIFDNEWAGWHGRIWIIFDVLQLIYTVWIVPYFWMTGLAQAEALGIGYVVFLFIDLQLMIQIPSRW